jgi:peroxiredoxin Q/BCP
MRSWCFAGAVSAALAIVLVGCRQKDGEKSAAASAAAASEPPPLDTSWQRDPGRLLAVGEAAPNFDGIGHTGMRIRLGAFLDKPVVVYFYADDRSPEGAAEARGFRDAWLRLTGRTSMVFGISPADRILHRDFATAEELPFLLVSDEKREIAKAFGVPLENGRTKAACFVVGKDGKVLNVITDVAPEAVAAEALRVLGAP